MGAYEWQSCKPHVKSPPGRIAGDYDYLFAPLELVESVPLTEIRHLLITGSEELTLSESHLDGWDEDYAQVSAISLILTEDRRLAMRVYTYVDNRQVSRWQSLIEPLLTRHKAKFVSTSVEEEGMQQAYITTIALLHPRTALSEISGGWVVI